MKKKLLICISCTCVSFGYCQTNKLEATGNAGVGTTSPSEKLQVVGNILTERIRTTGAILNNNSRSAFSSFNSGNHPTLTTGWIAADFGGIDNLSDRMVLGSGYGGKVIIASHNYNLTDWGGAMLIAPLGGNVGIGGTDPAFKLDVRGTGNFSNKVWFSYGNNSLSGYSWTDAALTTNSIEIVNHNGVSTTVAPTLAFHAHGDGGPQFRLAIDGTKVLFLESSGFNSARKPIAYGGGPNEYFSRLHIDAGLTTKGNVGIGTTNPSSKLEVNGSIRTKEIKVEVSNWPDYVFDKSYELPTLSSTESHIKTKGHLPGIPSASQVKATGINLGAMNAKLLQKIEELTLYLIQQQKQISAQGIKIKNLETLINR
ncbi:MAG: hypothetical protein EOO89_18620 [Pedobacter sp.]|nr:MAG: hypothetical protein EOO89_18620 [Pedobacter sp.]